LQRRHIIVSLLPCVADSRYVRVGFSKVGVTGVRLFTEVIMVSSVT
jgi:hypothetical protein